MIVVADGEWAAAKHGGRDTRGWKKLHLGVDRSGVIVAHALTAAMVDDATVAIDLIGAVGDVASVTGDAAHDTVAFYEAASARDATGIVPPTRTANVSRRGRRSRARDRVITDVETLGWRQWKKVSGYHQQLVWKTLSSGTRPSSAVAFARAVRADGRSRQPWPGVS